MVPTMLQLRTALQKHPALVGLMLLLALCMKLLVPAGFMVAPATQTFTVSICSDQLGQRLTGTMTLPVDPSRGSDAANHAKAECPFSGLAFALTGPVTGFAAAALAFVLALGFAPIAVPELPGTVRLRPPLRGPPQQA